MKKLINLFLTLLIFCLIPTSVLASTDVHRLYHRGTREHLYTTDVNEKDVLSNNGWRYEGTGWVSADSGDPVFRLYSNVTHEHLYTKDQNEVNTLNGNGWVLDNSGKPLFYSGGSTKIYRLYNPGNGRHLLTKDLNEYNTLPGYGWNQEGQKLSCLS